MSADARDLFSTGDGCFAMSETEGWVVTTVADIRGQVTQNARITLSELVQNMQAFEAGLEALGDAGDRFVEVLLGFTPEGDRLLAAVAEEGMAIMEVSGDGVVRRRLCGPYSIAEAHWMADAVLGATTG